MGYCHTMTCCTQGIRPTVPVRWRGLDGMVGVYWQAEGAADARGYYLSPDPRIVFFLNDVSSHVLMSNRDGGVAAHAAAPPSKWSGSPATPRPPTTQ